MELSDSEEARAAIIRAVETQVRDGEPPETGQTLERLMREGYSREDAIYLIGSVLAKETFAIINEGREYDHAGFVAALAALPGEPE